MALVLFIKSRLKKKPPAPIQNLDPVAIMSEIKGTPFLHRAETAKRYVGNRAEWVGELYYAEATQTQGQVRLQLFIPDISERVSIWFLVRAKNYPGLNLLRDESQVKFQGTISAIQGTMIMMKDVRLVEWLPPRSWASSI